MNKVTDNNITKPRMANLELLRCLAMMMVIVLHYLDKGNILPELAGDKLNATGIAAWMLEAFCIVAVNVYMMISGYFLCTSSFKLSRLLQLWIQVWSYSVGIGMLAAFTGILPATEVNTHYFLTLLFPVSMGHYWFMTAYVFLYLLLPLIGRGVSKMTKEQMQLSLVLLLLAFSVMKTILPARLEQDAKGYDCLWYVCVFVAAAYVRRFGVCFLEGKARALALYVVACMGIAAETFLFRFIYLKTGSLGLIMNISYEYNHFLPFLGALGLFGVFRQMEVKGKIATLVVKIAPYTLGVYLLHENEGVRVAWQNWLWAGKVSSVGGLLIYTILAVLCVFACGIAVEFVRTRIMSGLHALLLHLKLYGELVEKLKKADNLFSIVE